MAQSNRMCVVHSVHIFHRATNADYRGSGFDRGHLAAAANHKWSQKAMEDTFYLSNVAPQVSLLRSDQVDSLKQTRLYRSHLLRCMRLLPHLPRVNYRN